MKILEKSHEVHYFVRPMIKRVKVEIQYFDTVYPVILALIPKTIASH